MGEGVPSARRVLLLITASFAGLVTGVLAVIGLVVATAPGPSAAGWFVPAILVTFFGVAGGTGAGILKWGSRGLPVPVPDPTREDRIYTAVRAELQRQQSTAGPSPVGNALLFVGTFALFALAQGQSGGVGPFIILVGVLLFHELGHWVGMKMFGYRDVRIFFVPFFGAATSGIRREAAPWQEGVVLLLGPLPGIAVGGAIALVTSSSTDPTLRDVAQMLLWINAFNLLPLTALDGGRLLNLILFSRHRLLEATFMTVASLAMGAIAFAMHSWVLGIVAYFGLASIPSSYGAAAGVAKIRELRSDLPEQLEQASDDLQLALFKSARSISSVRRFERPHVTIRWMRIILSRAHERSKLPSLATSATLFAAYAASLVLSLIAIVLLATGG